MSSTTAPSASSNAPSGDHDISSGDPDISDAVVFDNLSLLYPMSIHTPEATCYARIR